MKLIEILKKKQANKYNIRKESRTANMWGTMVKRYLANRNKYR